MKKSLLGIAAVTIALSAQGATLPGVFAKTTNHSYSKKSLTLNGSQVNAPFGFTASDGGTATTYLPIWYLEQVLHKLGITDNWNGHEWKITLPSSETPDYSSLNVGKGNSSIYLNGKLVAEPNSIAANDPSSGNETTFMPLWYLQTQVLDRIGVKNTWNGTTWTMTSSNGQAVTITKDQLVTAFAQGLGVNVDKITLPTSVGNVPALADVDQTYWNYIGISNSDTKYQPGANVSTWGQDIGLNRGLTSGSITVAELPQLTSNLAALTQGYYKDSNGTYHIQYPVKDEYAAYFKNAVGSGGPFWSDTTSIQQVVTGTYNYFNNVTFTVSGNVMTVTIPTYSPTDVHYVGFVGGDPSSSFEVSYDGGKTWSNLTEYLSYDSAHGAKSGVSSVKFRVPANEGFGLALSENVLTQRTFSTLGSINACVDSTTGKVVVTRN